MADTLKVTRFQNGDPIYLVYSPGVDTYFTLGQLTEPAIIYVNHDPTLFDGKYGAQYNDYTIIDSRELCPTGWHIPTNEDWKTLEIYLGLSTDEVDNMVF